MLRSITCLKYILMAGEVSRTGAPHLNDPVNLFTELLKHALCRCRVHGKIASLVALLDAFGDLLLRRGPTVMTRIASPS